MKQVILVYSILVLALGSLFAQPNNQKIIFPNPPNASSLGIYTQQTEDEGFILTGVTVDPFNGYLPRLIKLDANLQVEWDKTYLEQSPPPPFYEIVWPNSPCMQTPDGGYLMILSNREPGINGSGTPESDLLRLDAAGNVLWQKDLSSSPNIKLLKVLQDGSMLLTIFNNSPYNYDLLHLDQAGNLISQKTLKTYEPSGGYYSIVLSNGNILTAYREWSVNQFVTNLLCTDISGNVIWENQTTDVLGGFPENDKSTIVAMADGGFSMLYFQTPRIIYRYDALGNLIWESSNTAIPNSLRPESITVNANGQYVLSGATLASRGFIAQMNIAADGIEWSMESPEDGQAPMDSLNAIPTADGWAAGVGTATGNFFGFVKVNSNSGTSINTLSGRVAKDDNQDCAVSGSEPGLCQTYVVATGINQQYGTFTDCDGNYELILPAGDFTISVYPNELFFQLCQTVQTNISFSPGPNAFLTLNLPIESPELIHEIRGTVHLDANDNCLVDFGETALPFWNVELKTANGDYLYLSTGNTGEYKTFVPDGFYELTVQPFNLNFLVCAPATQVLNLVGPTPQTAIHDFLIREDNTCSGMRAELAHTPIRPCTTATIIAYFRNDGAGLAENASISVKLDPLLSFVSASQVPDMIDGQTLTFNLGDLPANPGGNWEDIKINVLADCALVLGDQVCVSASVTPQEMCFQAPGWSGAVVQVSGDCENNEGIFHIKNVGSAANATQLDYVITEDQIVLRTGSFQLNPGQELSDTVPGNGLPLTIIADQESGFPGDSSVVWNILNCGGTGGGQSTGFAGPTGPYSHQECFLVSSSFDPNDKNAIPEGRGPEHLVHPGTPLEYTIRFQNTGTDTAFLVVIRDTLSEHFDFSRIEPRGSSHPFTFSQINNNILQFTFENILLPDSNTNLAGSQGFVEFNIYPQENLANGTQVTNRAAIYFDYNEPVLTNTVLRTFGKYLIVTTDEPYAEILKVGTVPNPFSTEITFKLPVEAPDGIYKLEISNAVGQLIQSASFIEKTYLLRQDGLPSGILFWKILTEGKLVASGKIVAED